MNLRLPDGMRQRVKETAARHGRSMNTEIVRHIERGIDGPNPGRDTARIVMDIARALGVPAEVSDRGVLLLTVDAAA